MLASQPEGAEEEITGASGTLRDEHRKSDQVSGFRNNTTCGASGRYPTARHLHCAHCYYAKLSCFNKRHRLQLRKK